MLAKFTEIGVLATRSRKGASGRAPDSLGNGGRSQRIHEHGLHIWFGFYVHAFRMLRGAYEESGLASGDDWWELPFQKCDEVSLYEQRDDDTWLRQSVRLPRRGGPNRGPPTQPQRLAMGRVMARTTRLLATGLRAELGMAGPRRGGAGPSAEGGADGAASALEAIAAELDGIDSPVLLGGDAPTASTRGRTPVLQALRRPVVSDAVGCGPDLVAGVGEVFPVGDIGALAAALERAARDAPARSERLLGRLAAFTVAETAAGYERAAVAHGRLPRQPR